MKKWMPVVLFVSLISVLALSGGCSSAKKAEDTSAAAPAAETTAAQPAANPLNLGASSSGRAI